MRVGPSYSTFYADARTVRPYNLQFYLFYVPLHHVLSD